MCLQKLSVAETFIIFSAEKVIDCHQATAQICAMAEKKADVSYNHSTQPQTNNEQQSSQQSKHG